MADLTITADLLTRAAKRNCYAVPSTGMVFFGIRGLKPELPIDTNFGQSRAGQFSSIDFQHMNCTLGQWKVESGDIAIFPGSTVPSMPNIVRARERGGTGTNMLMLGRYEHEKGIHKATKPGGHRAFRQAMFFPVWRTIDNLSYDLSDKLDLGSDAGSFVWDNLHSAYSDSLDGYSSAGCQVVCGLPRSPARNNQPETGPWRTFIDNAYGISQNRFVYLLFSAEELAFLDKAEIAKDVTQLVRFGSSGPPVKDIQSALTTKGLLQGDPDGDFGRDSLRALMAFQARSMGPSAADGVCGGNTASMLGVTLPTLTKAKAAPQPSQPAPSATGDNPELEDESDLDDATLQRLRVIILGLTGAQPILTTTTPSTTVPAPMTTSQFDAERSRANFERAQALIKEFEGGFVDDPKDPGGATNFGITHRTLASWRKKPVTKQDVFNMSYDEAKDIYFAEYWSKSSCGSMPGPLALPVYNVAVHAGPGAAGNFLRRALNQNGATLKSEGMIDDETIGALAKARLGDLTSDFIDLYEAKLRAHPNFAHFKNGFLRRVAKLRVESDKWLAETGAEILVTPPIEPDNEGVSAVSNKEELIAELKKLLPAILAGGAVATGATTTSTVQPGVAAPGSAMPQDQADAIAAILRQILESSAGKPTLTPVNGALGLTIGKLLDGRKSFIGIVGAVLSSLLSPTAGVGAASTLGPLAALLPGALGTFLSGVAPVLLPIFLALTAWGGLGKLDKYAAQQK